MVKPLKIETWNANGMTNSQKMETFIFSQNIDIFLVSETHFTNKNYCHIPGYTLYHTMHPGKDHGETALMKRH